MKKTKFAAFLSTAIVCYLFWLILTGQIIGIFRGGASASVLIAGGAVSVLVALFSARFFIHDKAFFMFNPVRLFIMLFYLFFIFAWELIKANWDVARRALRPGKLKINPGIVKVPTGLKSEYALSMLANSITLTPGTITMDIADQDDKTYCYIHWIDVTAENGEPAGDAIKGTLEKWIRRIWE